MSGLLSDARSINQDIHEIHRQLWKCSDGYPLFQLKSSEWTLNTDLLYKEKNVRSKAEEYRINAANCEELASQQTERSKRKRYERMAEAWKALASEQDWLDGNFPLRLTTSHSLRSNGTEANQSDRYLRPKP